MILSSCSTYRPNDKVILYDTVFVTVNEEGNLEEITPGGTKRPNREITLSNPGDEFTFKKGETFKLIAEGIDFGNNTIRIIKSEGSDLIKLQVVEFRDSEIKLTKKCQTVTWRDPNFIPEINLKDVNEQQQIVITPTFNNKCEKTGYQIRYGSVERGCRAEAKVVLDRFNKCVGQIKQPKPRLKPVDLGDILFD